MEISVAEAHNRLSRLLNQIRKGPIHITRRGKPVGVIIDPIEYEGLRKVQSYLQMLNISQELGEGKLGADELYRASRDELEDRA